MLTIEGWNTAPFEKYVFFSNPDANLQLASITWYGTFWVTDSYIFY